MNKKLTIKPEKIKYINENIDTKLKNLGLREAV